jgi:membrane-bound metal-dependent hydrolase YbcI (DUF457 family)
MFIGHWGLSFGVRPFYPDVSLGTTFLAAQFTGILWPAFVAFGWETFRIVPGHGRVMPFEFDYYPWSHSLLATVVWGLLFGGIYYMRSHAFRQATMLFGLVVSHWLLDVVVHRRDLPMWFGDSPHVGFGLWDRTPVYLIVEFGMFFGGFYMYLGSTPGRRRTATVGLWSLVAVLSAIQLFRVFGSPPRREIGLALASQLQWVIVAAAWWIDRHRQKEPRRAYSTTHSPPRIAGCNDDAVL